MENALPWFRPLPVSRWRELVLPKEHGSWSLAFEPLVLGLLIAPSVPGGMFALSVAAAFLARRPLRIAWMDHRSERRAEARVALVALGGAAAAFFAGAVALGGAPWLAWLLPSIAAGAAFLHFDLRNAGREEAAEVAGAAAFAFLPAALAMLADFSPLAALALAVLMCGRSVPSVLCVRAALRAAKTGVRRTAPALVSALVAFALAIGFAQAGHVPLAAVALLGVLVLRAFALLVFPRPALRARTLGMIEGALGAVLVVTAAVTWPI